MNINLSKIKTEFIDKKYKLAPNDLPYRGTTFLDNKITVTLSSKKTTLGFKIFGKLSASISYKCVRCLKDIALMTELPFKLKFDEEKNSYIEYDDETN